MAIIIPNQIQAMLKYTCFYCFIFFPPPKLAIKWRCILHNGYHHMKWNWWTEFKSWTKLIAFHFALILLGKAWIHQFYSQLWRKRRKTSFFNFGLATSLRERKFWLQTNHTPLENWLCVTSFPMTEVLDKFKAESMCNDYF